MSTPAEKEGCDDGAAKDHLKRAEAELEHAVGDLETAAAKVRGAEADVREAEAEVEETKHRDGEIEVKVDGQVKRVPRGTYVVSVFKQLVGVAADRELDVVHHDVFKPLDDNAEITIHECEVFISHVRTGGSS
jgi:multidrug resistance efflux pump